MADFNKAFQELMKLEFSNPENFLHINTGEHGETVGGIYRVAHPEWAGWYLVGVALATHDNDIKKTSRHLFENKTFMHMVGEFYKQHFWNRMRLDEIYYQNTAEELFVMGVNTGCRTAIRKAQRLIGVTADGIIGSQTLKALNEYNEAEFDMKFDEIEKKFYADLIKIKPHLKIFEKGWRSRAEAI